MTIATNMVNFHVWKKANQLSNFIKTLFGVFMVLNAAQNDWPLNTTPPGWTVSDWLNSKPLILSDLQGKVVLVRWWTGPTCPYCINSSEALNEFHESYQKDGLRVIGFYHHKSRLPFDLQDVKDHVNKLGFKFPVAVDHDWKTLDEWWLKNDRRKWTSVSFLLDHHGVIRYIHPGGQYVKGDGEYEKLKEAIIQLCGS